MNNPDRMDTPAFDSFGEKVAGPAAPIARGDRRANWAAAIVFWTLALLLVTGRVYVGEPPALGTVLAALSLQ